MNQIDDSRKCAIWLETGKTFTLQNSGPFVQIHVTCEYIHTHTSDSSTLKTKWKVTNALGE